MKKNKGKDKIKETEEGGKDSPRRSSDEDVELEPSNYDLKNVDPVVKLPPGEWGPPIDIDRLNRIPTDSAGNTEESLAGLNMVASGMDSDVKAGYRSRKDRRKRRGGKPPRGNPSGYGSDRPRGHPRNRRSFTGKRKWMKKNSSTESDSETTSNGDANDNLAGSPPDTATPAPPPPPVLGRGTRPVQNNGAGRPTPFRDRVNFEFSFRTRGFSVPIGTIYSAIWKTGAVILGGFVLYKTWRFTSEKFKLLDHAVKYISSIGSNSVMVPRTVSGVSTPLPYFSVQTVASTLGKVSAKILRSIWYSWAALAGAGTCAYVLFANRFCGGRTIVSDIGNFLPESKMIHLRTTVRTQPAPHIEEPQFDERPAIKQKMPISTVTTDYARFDAETKFHYIDQFPGWLTYLLKGTRVDYGLRLWGLDRQYFSRELFHQIQVATATETCSGKDYAKMYESYLLAAERNVTVNVPAEHFLYDEQFNQVLQDVRRNTALFTTFVSEYFDEAQENIPFPVSRSKDGVG